MGSEGTYSVDDTRVTTVSSEGNTATEDLCVQGTKATFVGEDTITIMQKL